MKRTSQHVLDSPLTCIRRQRSLRNHNTLAPTLSSGRSPVSAARPLRSQRASTAITRPETSRLATAPMRANVGPRQFPTRRRYLHAHPNVTAPLLSNLGLRANRGPRQFPHKRRNARSAPQPKLAPIASRVQAPRTSAAATRYPKGALEKHTAHAQPAYACFSTVTSALHASTVVKIPTTSLSSTTIAAPNFFDAISLATWSSGASGPTL
jgi:hypothetical protein